MCCACTGGEITQIVNEQYKSLACQQCPEGKFNENVNLPGQYVSACRDCPAGYDPLVNNQSSAFENRCDSGLCNENECRDENLNKCVEISDYNVRLANGSCVTCDYNIADPNELVSSYTGSWM